MPTSESTLHVVIFGRQGCHLCEQVEAEVRTMSEMVAGLTVVDIDGDPVLHDRYILRVPVLTVGDKEVFEAKMMDTRGRWKATLESLLKGLT